MLADHSRSYQLLSLTRSPQIERRSHVLNVCKVAPIDFHAGLAVRSRMNLTLCSNDPKPRSGTWNRRFEDLKRKGRGGDGDSVYATTLLAPLALDIVIASKDNYIPRVCHIALSRLQLHLVNLSTSCQRQQASSGNMSISPICQPQLNVVLRLQRQCVACPCKQCLPLCDEPILTPIQIYSHDRRDRRLCRDESGYRACGRDLLVEERDADWGATKWFEE